MRKFNILLMVLMALCCSTSVFAWFSDCSFVSNTVWVWNDSTARFEPDSEFEPILVCHFYGSSTDGITLLSNGDSDSGSGGGSSSGGGSNSNGDDDETHNEHCIDVAENCAERADLEYEIAVDGIVASVQSGYLSCLLNAGVTVATGCVLTGWLGLPAWIACVSVAGGAVVACGIYSSSLMVSASIQVGNEMLLRNNKKEFCRLEFVDCYIPSP